MQPRLQQPDSDRPNIKTLELGTLNAPNRSTTNWDTLGLERRPDEFPVGLTARQIRIRDDNNDRVRFVGNFTLAAGQSIDPVTEQVTLRFSTGSTVYFSVELPPGSFERRQNSTPARWKLTDQARDTFNLERFDILEGDGSIHFVDRRTAALVPADYTDTTIEFAVGNDRGSANVTLEERPPGSGSWRLDR